MYWYTRTRRASWCRCISNEVIARQRRYCGGFGSGPYRLARCNIPLKLASPDHQLYTAPARRTTGLGDGTRVPKENARVEAYGTVDEANSAIGLVLAVTSVPPAIAALLLDVQHDLFDLGGELATPGMTLIKEEHTARIEQAIDTFNADLPSLKEFILPSGGSATAACHLARTITRAQNAACGPGGSSREREVRVPHRLPIFVVLRECGRGTERSGDGKREPLRRSCRWAGLRAQPHLIVGLRRLTQPTIRPVASQSSPYVTLHHPARAHQVSSIVDRARLFELYRCYRQWMRTHQSGAMPQPSRPGPSQNTAIGSEPD